MATTTDYDARRTVNVADDDSLEEWQGRRRATKSATTDADEPDPAAEITIHGADQLDEELTATVVPMQSYEFRCSRCFLVRHRSQRAQSTHEVCQDCS